MKRCNLQTLSASPTIQLFLLVSFIYCTYFNWLYPTDVVRLPIQREFIWWGGVEHPYPFQIPGSRSTQKLKGFLPGVVLLSRLQNESEKQMQPILIIISEWGWWYDNDDELKNYLGIYYSVFPLRQVECNNSSLFLPSSTPNLKKTLSQLYSYFKTRFNNFH